jgi:DNA-binding MarR family transcriptional regulator
MTQVPSSSDIEKLLREDYVRSYYRWVQLLTEHLADCSRVFDGDLQELLILSVVGQANFGEITRGGGNSSIGRFDASRGQGASASGISAVTGIPRETVRRKLERLQKKGWIEKLPSTFWRLRSDNGAVTSRDDLIALEDRAIERAARFVGIMNQAFARHRAEQQHRTTENRG